MEIDITQAIDFEVLSEQQKIYALAQARVSIFIVGQHLNGTDKLAFRGMMKDVRTELDLVLDGTLSIFPQICAIEAQLFEIEQTTFPINMELLKQVFNTLMQSNAALYKVANDAIAEALLLKIPSEIMGLFSLADLTVAYEPDYIMLGVSPSFEPKQMAEAFSQWQY